ncbi:MAG: thiamine-phosphate kinase [Actinomycetota bacterium]
MNLADLGEFGLIERLARKLAASHAPPAAGSVSLAIGDDAALLQPPPGAGLGATADPVIEEVHFRRDWSKPEDVGWKSLAVNVSDLSAMGARPLGALVTVALPADAPVSWVDRFYRGLGDCAVRYGCPIVGGDTVRSPRHIAISVTALGTVTAGRAVRRSGAKVGDLICVTGVLGGSGAGLALLQGGRGKTRKYASLLARHRRPGPPVPAGSALAEAGLPTAMMDLSDGLGSDLRHLARASGVGARLHTDCLPISDDARQAARELGVDPARWALFGGEDYELLFTVSADRFPEVPPTLGPLGVVATIVGEITPRRVTVLDADGREAPLRPEGFAHFIA